MGAPSCRALGARSERRLGVWKRRMRHYARNRRADKPTTNTSPAPRGMGDPATGGISGAFAELRAAASDSWQALRGLWTTPAVLLWRDRVQRWRALPYSGAAVLFAGTILTTLLVLAVDRAVPLPDPGVVYLPLIAMLAYHWSWRYGALAGLLQLACLYILAAGCTLRRGVDCAGGGHYLHTSVGAACRQPARAGRT